MHASQKTGFPFRGRPGEIIETLRRAGACSVDLAKSLQELNLKDSPAFRNLIRKGIVIHAGSRTYFLDERQWLRHRLNWVKWGMVGLLSILLLFYWLFF